MDQAKKILDSSIRDFAEATAAKQPTPGGGSVAGVVASLAVALGEMSLNFTRGKKKFAEHEELYAKLGNRMKKSRKMFGDLIADDIAAYGMYSETAKLPDGPQKDEAVQLALAASVDVPRQMAKLSLALLGDLKLLGECCNPYLVSDLIAAATLAAAVTVMCDLNVRVNTTGVTETDAANDIRTASTADRKKAAHLAAQIEQDMQMHLG